MRSYPVFCVFVLIAGLIPFVCSFFFGRRPQPRPPQQQPPICVLNLKDCESKVTVCGRMGLSNQCQKFKNNCHMEVANCNQAAYYALPYAVADEKLCEDIPLNNRGLCKGVPQTYPNGGYYDGSPNGGYYGGYPYGGYPNVGSKWPFGIFGNVF